MDTYASEDEQVEALKKWWKENGLSVALGLVLGLVVVFGWRGWQGWQMEQNLQASAVYAEFEKEPTEEHGNLLMTDFPASPYTLQALLKLADLAVVAHNHDVAEKHWQWMIAHSEVSGFTHIARLRLAKLWLSDNKSNQVQELLSSVTLQDGFALAYQELLGDLHYQQGQLQAAAKYYRSALGYALALPSANERIQLKLDDLGLVGDVGMEKSS
jgi:predicted negative regulator of RcsB-dependent stress response